MDAPGSVRPSGFVGALRALADGFVAGVQDRLRLLSLELQEEKFRAIQTLVWIVAAMLMGALALAFASLALVYYFRESDRLVVLVALACFYGVASLGVLLGLRRFLFRQPPPFAASLEELEQDRRCLRDDL